MDETDVLALLALGADDDSQQLIRDDTTDDAPVRMFLLRLGLDAQRLISLYYGLG